MNRARLIRATATSAAVAAVVLAGVAVGAGSVAASEPRSAITMAAQHGAANGDVVAGLGLSLMLTGTCLLLAIRPGRTRAEPEGRHP